MVKASIPTVHGNNIDIEGTPEEIVEILQGYNTTGRQGSSRKTVKTSVGKLGFNKESLMPIAKDVFLSNTKWRSTYDKEFYVKVVEAARQRGINKLIPPPMVKGAWNSLHEAEAKQPSP